MGLLLFFHYTIKGIVKRFFSWLKRKVLLKSISDPYYYSYFESFIATIEIPSSSPSIILKQYNRKWKFLAAFLCFFS